ncbi:MAG: tetratricopeptide repeat protein [Bacteroidetes bacterium]|nr:tetratricopeptide repeat protein [Bacteroidota bacterium]
MKIIVMNAYHIIVIIVAFISVNKAYANKVNYVQVLNQKMQVDFNQSIHWVDSLVETDAIQDTTFFEAVYENLAIELNGRSQYATSARLANKLIQWYTFKKDPYRNLLLRRLEGISYMHGNDRNRAKTIFNDCLADLASLPQKKQQKLRLELLINLGVAYGMDEEVMPAMKQFVKADSLALVMNQEEKHITLLEYQANMYAAIQDHKKAIDLYQEALIWYQANNNWKGALSSSDNLASSYAFIGEYDRALLLLKEARGYARQLDDKYGLACNFAITAETFQSLEKHAEAIGYFKKSINIFDSLNLKYKVASTMNNYAKSLWKMGQLQQSIELSRKQLKMAQSIGYREYVKHAYFNLWQAYDRLGELDEAYECVQWYYWLHDSIIKGRFNSEVAMLQNSIENQLKEAKIERLELEKQLEAEKAQKSKTFNQWLIMGAILMLLIAVVLFFLLRNIRKAQKEILTQRDQLQRSDQEKAVLLKELHHRVKNNLQIVSSLLNMQGDSVKDEKALEAFREGQNRVDAMAMIHKHLYATDELTSVDISGYLERLVNSLAYSYGFNSINFTLNTNITRNPIDVDIAIPIGLIVNELASNTFKHAFSKEKMAELSVILKQNGNELHLEMKDNGKGLPQDFSFQNLDSFGMELVYTLVKQLKGDIGWKNNGGAHFSINLKPNKALAA